MYFFFTQLGKEEIQKISTCPRLRRPTGAKRKLKCSKYFIWVQKTFGGGAGGGCGCGVRSAGAGAGAGYVRGKFCPHSGVCKI